MFPHLSDRLAESLVAARRDGTPILAGQLPPLSVDDAYEIQGRLTNLTLESGDRVAGYKVGLTSDAAMAAFAASEPIAGPMFASSILRVGQPLDRQRICDARIEGEVLIEISNPALADCDDAALLNSIHAIRPAIEIADSRIVGWASTTALAIADDACCGWVVAGDPVDPHEIDLANVEMQLVANGEIVSSGRSANCLGNPLTVYRWFLAKANRLGWRVSPGDLLLTGALGPAVPAAASSHFRASLSNLGDVDLSLRPNANVR